MAANNTMGKSFFLFYVDLPQVARMIVEQSYKAIANAYKRKNHESELNQRLMDKYERIEAISANLKNSEEFESSESLQLQLQEVQDMVSLKKNLPLLKRPLLSVFLLKSKGYTIRVCFNFQTPIVDIKWWQYEISCYYELVVQGYCIK